MSNVTTIPLQSISTVSKGKKPASTSPIKLDDSYRPYILIESFDRKYSKFTNDDSCQIVTADDIEMVWDGERAGLVSTGHTGYLGSTLASITVDNTIAHPSFVYFTLQLNQQQLRRLAEGTGVPHLSRYSVDSLPVYNFPLTEQKKIASILTSVDELIKNRQKQVSKLQDLRKAVVNELLTNGIGHIKFKDSELGRVPKNWSILSLAEVSINKGIQTGPFGSQLHAYEYTETGTPVIMPKDMKSPLLITETISRISEKRVDSLSKHKVLEGDIIFSRRGDIGRFALIARNNSGWICGTGCIRARLNHNIIHPFFISQYLTQDYPIEWLNLNAVGLTMPNLNTSILENLPVLIPPREEQSRIVSVLQSIDKRILDCEAILKKNKSLKEALMQDLLTGKTRVKVS